MSEEKHYARCLCMGAGPALTATIEKFGASDEVRDHFRAARVEFLKGIRALIDSRIEELSRQQEEKGATIPVE